MAQDDFSQQIDAVAALVGLEIPTACRPGVESNLAVLLSHARIVAAYDDDPGREPTELLSP